MSDTQFYYPYEKKKIDIKQFDDLDDANKAQIELNDDYHNNLVIRYKDYFCFVKDCEMIQTYMNLVVIDLITIENYHQYCHLWLNVYMINMVITTN